MSAKNKFEVSIGTLISFDPLTHTKKLIEKREVTIAIKEVIPQIEATMIFDSRLWRRSDMSDYFEGNALVQTMFQPKSGLGKNAWSTKGTIKLLEGKNHFGMFIFFSFSFSFYFHVSFWQLLPNYTSDIAYLHKIDFPCRNWIRIHKDMYNHQGCWRTLRSCKSHKVCPASRIHQYLKTENH